MRRRRVAVLGCLLAVVVLAGCSSLFGESGPQETLTPVSLDNESATVPGAVTPTPGPSTQSELSVSDSSAVQSRYASLRPTCDRPPALVVHIQVNALKNNDPQVDEGINTTYRFASPDNRVTTGPLSNFAALIKSQFSPLLNAETVTYGPLSRQNGTASQRVTVETSDGQTQSYIWRLERQSGGEYDGCWLTSSVRPAGPDAGSPS